MTPSRLQPVRPSWRALGWPGAAGGLALGVAAWLASGLGPRPPATLDASSARAAATAAASPLSATARSTRLQAAPPVAERLAHLLELAVREGVAVQRTEQRPRGAAEAGTQLHMPVRASYADLRRFVEQALNGDPHLALESLRLQRASVDEAEYEVDLVWWMAGAGR